MAKKRFVFISRVDGTDTVMSYHTSQDAAENAAIRFVKSLDKPDSDFVSSNDEKFLIAEVRAEVKTGEPFIDYID